MKTIVFAAMLLMGVSAAAQSQNVATAYVQPDPATASQDKAQEIVALTLVNAVLSEYFDSFTLIGQSSGEHIGLLAEVLAAGTEDWEAEEKGSGVVYSYTFESEDKVLKYKIIQSERLKGAVLTYTAYLKNDHDKLIPTNSGTLGMASDKE